MEDRRTGERGRRETSERTVREKAKEKRRREERMPTKRVRVPMAVVIELGFKVAIFIHKHEVKRENS